MVWALILSGVLTSTPVINEVSWGNLQWVEIYNPHDAPIHLDGWTLKNSRGSDPLYGTIPPRGYAVIVTSQYEFEQIYPNTGATIIEVPDGVIGSGLTSNDLLLLVNPHGDVVDFVNWGDPDPTWPNYLPQVWSPGIQTHQTVIGRIPNGYDSDQPFDWRGIRVPTPGSENLLTTGLTPASWGKIKAIFSIQRRSF